jgi:outer membrane protein TolC
MSERSGSSFRASRHRRDALSRLIALALVLAGAAPAQDRGALEDALAPLIEEALASNVGMAAGEATVAQRLAELDVARAQYRPVVDLSARYSRADGGRTFDIPVGDLLNPVYDSLSQLTGRSFPHVDNESIAFLREEEQDTRVSLSQAIYDPRIAPVVDATRSVHRGATAALATLRARVVRDTKQGYYRWLSARENVAIADSALELARENLRVNESLHAHGKITRDLVLRAEADTLSLEEARRAAASNATLAASYVNLLRNAALDAPLPDAPIDAESPRRVRRQLETRYEGPLELAPLTDAALAHRPELAELDAAIDASAAQEAFANAAFKPSVGFAVDAGVQGVDYGIDSEDRFVFASVVVRFNAYDGGADRGRVRAAHEAGNVLAAQREQAVLSIRLEVQTALEQLGVAEASLDTADRRVAAAQAAFDIASRKRDLGQISSTEFIDARRTLTDARLNLNLTRAGALSRLADVEYATGLAPVPY